RFRKGSGEVPGMDSTTSLLGRLAAAGGTVEVRDGGRLTVKVPKAAEDLGREVMDRKAEVLVHLADRTEHVVWVVVASTDSGAVAGRWVGDVWFPPTGTIPSERAS